MRRGTRLVLISDMRPSLKKGAHLYREVHMFDAIICSRLGRFCMGLLITTVTTANAWGAEQTLFSARFSSESKSPLTLVILRNSDTGPHSLRETKAEIRKGRQLEATCSLSRVEIMDDHSHVIDMKCRSARLMAFVSPVSIFFTPSSSPASRGPSRSPAVAQTAFVRFGSWLQGYQQAVLTIDYDHSRLIMNQQGNPQGKSAVRLAQK
jgi:hypothetical protein